MDLAVEMRKILEAALPIVGTSSRRYSMTDLWYKAAEQQFKNGHDVDANFDGASLKKQVVEQLEEYLAYIGDLFTWFPSQVGYYEALSNTRPLRRNDTNPRVFYFYARNGWLVEYVNTDNYESLLGGWGPLVKKTGSLMGAGNITVDDLKTESAFSEAIAGALDPTAGPLISRVLSPLEYGIAYMSMRNPDMGKLRAINPPVPGPLIISYDNILDMQNESGSTIDRFMRRTLATWYQFDGKHTLASLFYTSLSAFYGSRVKRGQYIRNLVYFIEKFLFRLKELLRMYDGTTDQDIARNDENTATRSPLLFYRIGSWLRRPGAIAELQQVRSAWSGILEKFNEEAKIKPENGEDTWKEFNNGSNEKVVMEFIFNTMQLGVNFKGIERPLRDHLETRDLTHLEIGIAYISLPNLSSEANGNIVEIGKTGGSVKAASLIKDLAHWDERWSQRQEPVFPWIPSSLSASRPRAHHTPEKRARSSSPRDDMEISAVRWPRLDPRTNDDQNTFERESRRAVIGREWGTFYQNAILLMKEKIIPALGRTKRPPIVSLRSEDGHFVLPILVYHQENQGSHVLQWNLPTSYYDPDILLVSRWLQRNWLVPIFRAALLESRESVVFNGMTFATLMQLLSNWYGFGNGREESRIIVELESGLDPSYVLPIVGAWTENESDKPVILGPAFQWFSPWGRAMQRMKYHGLFDTTSFRQGPIRNVLQDMFDRPSLEQWQEMTSDLFAIGNSHFFSLIERASFLGIMVQYAMDTMLLMSRIRSLVNESSDTVEFNIMGIDGDSFSGTQWDNAIDKQLLFDTPPDLVFCNWELAVEQEATFWRYAWCGYDLPFTLPSSEPALTNLTVLLQRFNILPRTDAMALSPSLRHCVYCQRPIQFEQIHQARYVHKFGAAVCSAICFALETERRR